MFGGVASAINSALQGQVSRLAGLAEAYKQRTIYEIKSEVKTQVAAAGIMVALVAVWLVFLVIAVVIGFAALYYWVALWHGTLAGLGVAGGAALVLSLLMFSIVAIRASSSAAIPPPEIDKIKADARDALRKTQAAVAGLKSNIGTLAQDKASELGKQSIAAATGVMRNGSREAVLATLAATAVIGLLLGRTAR